MPIPLDDGSVVGDGSQIGMFPVLADQSLDKPCTLLRTSTNPRMDLVLLIVKDASSATAPAATAPPGMSAAQFALVQRMLAARQRGAHASTAQGVPEPKRGPQIHLVLWRMGDDSASVWEIPLSFEKVMDPGAGQEHEDLCLHDVAWSPKGDRLGVLASVRRSPVAATSTAASRTKTFLRTYSVQDGRLLSTVQIGQGEAQAFDEPMTLHWLDIDWAPQQDAVDGSSESLLSKLSPLPALPAADTFASAGAGGNLMPHQLRMMQMSGQKPHPSFQFPSQLALQGRGPLARIPHLARSNADLRLIEGGDAMLTLDLDSALPLSPESVVLVSQPTSARVELLLDGQTSIGSLPLPQHQGEGSESWPSRTLSISQDLTSLTCLSTSTNAALSHSHLRLPLSLTTRYGPASTRRRISAISRASHLLRFHLGYALDSSAALQQVYQSELVKKVLDEWVKNIDDLSVKFGGDMKYELINVLLTGRAGPAAEQFLLGNLTEGVLTRLEQQALSATYSLKKLIAESLRPAIERSIIALSGLLGQVRFYSGREGEKELKGVEKMLKAALDSTLSLGKEVDMEALISQEFYRWCRTERERQERIKQDQDEPRLPVIYDVHFVAKYIDRGFENVEIKRRLGNELPLGMLEKVLGEERKVGSLKEALEASRAFLASPSVTEEVFRKDGGGEKEVLPIVPMLTKAIEALGGQLSQLLDAGLEMAEIETAPLIRAGGEEWNLVREAPPAVSLSSTATAPDQPQRVCSTSFLSNATLLSAYILHSPSDSSSSILTLRTSPHTLEPEVAHFTIPTTPSIIDLGFYGDAELLVLAHLPSASISVLLAFSIPHLPFNDEGLREVRPVRATEFEPGFKAGGLAVNTNKQTVTVVDEDGRRVVYLDISMVEGEEGVVGIMEEES